MRIYHVLSINKLIVFAVSLTIIIGCTQHTESNNNNKEKTDSLLAKHREDSKKKATPIKYDRSFDDAAKYMAGISQNEGSILKEFEKKDFWKNHKSSFDSSWSTIEKTRLIPMRAWADKELTVAHSNGLNLFYPFGGPDFLNAYTLFPQSKNMTLIGLEPVGSVPDLTQFKDNALSDYLNSVYDALGDIFKRSYFITHKMVQDMHSNQISGTTPLLYVFLARTNNTIVNVERVGINNNGTLEPYTVDVKNKPTTKVSPGVRIDYIPANDTTVHSLYYFCLNLLDAKLVETPGIMKYIGSLGTVNTYVKSASYLMHYLTFNNIRNAVLKQSATILQDDSGIAYRFFDKNEWDFKFYGRYMRPVDDFKWVFEKDLQEVYQKDTTIKPVPFILGYHWDSNGINLLRAVRKSHSTAAKADTVAKKIK